MNPAKNIEHSDITYMQWAGYPRSFGTTLLEL